MEMKTSTATLYRHLAELSANGYLRICGGNKAQGYSYRISNTTEYTQLQENMQNELNNTLGKLKEQACLS
jgi:hypothetical protein